MSICASYVARADAASDEANAFRDDSFQLPDQATVSPGCVFQPDFTCSNCIYRLVDQCGWGKVFQIVSSRFLSESLLNHWPKRGILNFVMVARFCFKVLCEGCKASEFIDLKVFDSERSDELFVLAMSLVRIVIHFSLRLCLALGGLMSRVSASFCWIRSRLDGNRYIT